MEFRVWTVMAKRVVKKAGILLRSEDSQPKRCRICAAAVPSCTQRSLCAEHVRSFCCKCDSPLPLGRVSRWCTECERAGKERLYIRPDRRCTVCSKGKPTPRGYECAACHHAKYWL